MSETPNTKRQSVINRSSVKAYALKVSKERRAGKFLRVSEDFLTDVESSVESAIRGVKGFAPENPVSPEDNIFVTGEAMRKIKETLNERVRHIIAGKVMQHPSLGVTLKS